MKESENTCVLSLQREIDDINCRNAPEKSTSNMSIDISNGLNSAMRGSGESLIAIVHFTVWHAARDDLANQTNYCTKFRLASEVIVAHTRLYLTVNLLSKCLANRSRFIIRFSGGISKFEIQTNQTHTGRIAFTWSDLNFLTSYF